MRWHNLSLRDRDLFERALARPMHELAAATFLNIFIWRALYRVRWTLIEGCLCVFYEDRVGRFMPLPPLGAFDAKVAAACFKAMDEVNATPALSRIENIEALLAASYVKAGFHVREVSRDAVIARSRIASLKGAALKHRRNLYNHFVKHTVAEFRDYKTTDRGRVLALFERWRLERGQAHKESLYRSMLADSRAAFKEMLAHARCLGLVAKVVVVDGAIAAFTAGVPVSPSIFTVSFEVADLRYKGIAQFIFTEFARSRPEPELNIMDDSGLEPLARHKKLFHPDRSVPSFAATTIFP
jgi:hypothetical protein